MFQRSATLGRTEFGDRGALGSPRSIFLITEHIFYYEMKNTQGQFAPFTQVPPIVCFVSFVSFDFHRKNSKSDLKKSDLKKSDLKIGIRWNPLESIGFRWNPLESVGIR